MTAESLLPTGSAAGERAIEAVSAARLDRMTSDVVKAVKRPSDCPAHLLGFLAYELSVDLWDEAWPEWKKRSVIASALRDHRLKGTRAGLDRFLQIAGGRLVQIATPPSGVFASRNLTKAEWDALIARHPRLRITLARRRGQYRRAGGIVADAAFAGDAHATPDHAPILIGRRALLVQDGVERDLPLYRITPADIEGPGFERIVLPGRSADALFAGGGFLGRSFAGAQIAPPRFHSFRLPRGYAHASGPLQLSTLPTGLTPRDLRYRRESARGDRGRALFIGDCAARGFVAPDRGGDLLADILHLHDPAVAVPQVAAFSFADHARVAMPHHQAEMLVDWQRRLAPGRAFIVGQSFVDREPVALEDRGLRDFLLGAIARSARATDRLKVSFQTHRPRRLGDGLRLDGGARLGASIPNRL